MFKKHLSRFKCRLTTFGDAEPLNKLSLAVIILLDIFILSIVFEGLDDHTRQLTSPDEYMPHAARAIFIDQTWSPSERMDNLQTIVLTDRKHYSYNSVSLFEKEKLERMHPLYRAFSEKTKALTQDAALQKRFIQREQKIRERNKLTQSQRKTKQAYDTQLLEKIARVESSDPALALASRSKNLTKKIDQLTREINQIEREIDPHPGVQEIWAMTAPDSQIRQKMVTDFRRYEYQYKFKEFGWQLLFLIPLFGVFYIWSTKSSKKSARIQSLISSHMLVIASIPILLKLIELVVDLIPKHFFKALFKILKNLHLIAVWHYLVIFAAVLIGILLIVLIQKKVFNREKIMQKRLSKGDCSHCGKHLPHGSIACPFCGAKQMAPCPNCHQSTPTAGSYCIHCGKKNKPATRPPQ